MLSDLQFSWVKLDSRLLSLVARALLVAVSLNCTVAHKLGPFYAA